MVLVLERRICYRFVYPRENAGYRYVLLDVNKNNSEFEKKKRTYVERSSNPHLLRIRKILFKLNIETPSYLRYLYLGHPAA